MKRVSNDPLAEMCQNVLNLVREMTRIRKLNNRELVSEVRATNAADDPLIQEMMTRLWPDWDEEYYEQGE